MDEKPIERLNYYNGQRLEADDLKLEQSYHIRVRRWLNRTLFPAGIAEGLEVVAEVDDQGKPTNNVSVSPGLALDAEGREIILLEQKSIPVVGKQNLPGKSEGNYLFIQYREETRAEDSDSCAPRGTGRPQGQLAWGGPSRVRATPILGWSDIFPHDSSGKVVLAQVELDGDCAVSQVYTYPRQYTGIAAAKTVRQYALEGERHIDANNPGRVYFHIRGRQPNAVTLYLRAERFSTLFYTELGKHGHITSKTGTDPTTGTPNYTSSDPKTYQHRHGLSATKTDTENAHEHSKFETAAFGGGGGEDGSLTITPTDYSNDMPAYGDIMAVLSWPTGRGTGWNIAQSGSDKKTRGKPFIAKISGASDHYHIFGSTETTDSQTVKDDHTHNVTPSLLVSDAGIDSWPARTGQLEKALTYVDQLQIYIGKVKVDAPPPDPPKNPPDEENRTTDILTQLNHSQPDVHWLDQNKHGTLGNGDKSHALVQRGTGEIRLDLLSPDLSFPEGDYYIQLQVEGEGNGGRILYNLYVE